MPTRAFRAIEPVAVAFPVASAAIAMPTALGAPVTTAEPAAAETRREYVVGGGDVLRNGNFIKQPQVAVLLVQVRGNQASVLGMANRPGRYPLEVNGESIF